MNVKSNLSELIGNTPLLELARVTDRYKLRARLIAKLEYMNPLGSAKDRTAVAMLDDAEQKGKLNRDTVIVETTNGNTGVALAFACISRGYRIILTMPENVSEERKHLLRALGADLHLTSAELGMPGAMAAAQEISKTLPDCFRPMQFENPANPEAHRKTTGPEIWRDTDGMVDILVASIGTGGTVTGAGQSLKDRNPRIKVIGVEPEGSPVISGGTAGTHNIQGIGVGFIPETLDLKVLDEIISVTDEDAFAMTRVLAMSEGVLAGVSSGAAVHAATLIARRPENEGKTIVIILPDAGERCLSTGVFDRK